MKETNSIHSIQPLEVRYIKLGRGGAWFERCIADGVIEFGHRAVPHALALGGRAAVDAFLVDQGRTPGKAKDFAREVHDFYELGAECLWITIGAGRLWWAFAEAEVIPLTGEDCGARMRKVIGSWSDCDLAGTPLRLETLSTRLTKVAAYRQTLCRVDAQDYLLRRINAQSDPATRAAQDAKARLVASAGHLIEQLDWRDFELLVDLIFAGSGWRRSSAVGGSDQADTDLILEQAVTGERAFVQVKSRASQGVLNDYVERFRASGFERLFFVCHSPMGALAQPSDPRAHLWLGDTLADQAVKAGLFDWLMEKAR